MKQRKPELEQHKQIWLTKKAYDFLRDKKREEKKSMARLLDNLLKKHYG